MLVCDGAMGTMLYAKGIFLNRSFDELNLTQPDLVAEVHQAYIRAGADVVETNTFGANRVKLGAFGLGDRVAALNTQGARIARHAARDAAYVAGSIGPLGHPHRAVGEDRRRRSGRTLPRAGPRAARRGRGSVRARDVPRRQRDRRRDPGRAQRLRAPDRRADDDGRRRQQPGRRGAGDVRAAARAAGASLVGVNCSVGPAAMLETVERMGRVASVPLAAQPNAGRPREIEGRNIYLSSPEYMASYARRFIGQGVRLVGGCCGTTPEHIRHIKMAVRGSDTACHRVGVRAAADRDVAPDRTGRAGRARREVTDGERAHPRRVRGERRAAAAARLPGGRARRAGAPAAHSRRGSRQHPGWPAGERPDERAGRLPSSCSSRRGSRRSCTTRAATETCSACSRTCSARTRWACATCCLITGDPPNERRLPGRDGRLRRRFDRPHQRGGAVEPGARHRRPADRSADGVSHRRRGEPCGAQPRRGGPAVRIQGRGRRGVRRHAAGVRSSRS